MEGEAVAELEAEGGRTTMLGHPHRCCLGSAGLSWLPCACADRETRGDLVRVATKPYVSSSPRRSARSIALTAVLISVAPPWAWVRRRLVGGCPQVGGLGQLLDGVFDSALLYDPVVNEDGRAARYLLEMSCNQGLGLRGDPRHCGVSIVRERRKAESRVKCGLDFLLDTLEPSHSRSR